MKLMPIIILTKIIQVINNNKQFIMKNKFIQIFSLFLTLGFLTSCHTESDNETNLYSGDSYISFGTVSTLSALENSTSPVTLTAYASVPNITSDISVDFTITPDNASASDYSVVGNKTSFTFGPGKYTDEIQILPVNNFDEDGNKILNITLSSTSSEHTLGFPGPDSNGKTIVVTFLDDDCAFTYQEIGDATWSGQDTVPATQAGPNESQITTSYDGTNLLIEGIGYPWITDTAYWDEVVIVSHELIATIDAQTEAGSYSDTLNFTLT